MAKNLLDLARSLEQRVGKLDTVASNLAVKIATSILKELTDITPVDTSKALSNWQVSLDEPVNFSIEPYFSGKSGSTEEKSAAAAFSEGKVSLYSKEPGEAIYVSNLLPYIQRLNEGYSSQAPAGFVERAVLFGRNEAVTVKIKV